MVPKNGLHTWTLSRCYCTVLAMCKIASVYLITLRMLMTLTAMPHVRYDQPHS